MKRTKMIEELASGEDPLEVSIKKWEDIVNEKGTDMGRDNCALCYEYYFCHQDNRYDEYCYGCPIYEKTGEDSCKDTPYQDWGEHKKDEGRFGEAWVECPECTELAQKELDFLKSLRKEK